MNIQSQQPVVISNGYKHQPIVLPRDPLSDEVRNTHNGRCHSYNGRLAFHRGVRHITYRQTGRVTADIAHGSSATENAPESRARGQQADGRRNTGRNPTGRRRPTEWPGRPPRVLPPGGSMAESGKACRHFLARGCVPSSI